MPLCKFQINIQEVSSTTRDLLFIASNLNHFAQSSIDSINQEGSQHTNI
jgi:hypothetical protein